MNRYDYSVINVATDLHSQHTGSSEDYETARDYSALLAWLRWRVEEAWEPTTLGGVASSEEAIRAFARAVIADSDRRRARGWTP